MSFPVFNTRSPLCWHSKEPRWKAQPGLLPWLGQAHPGRQRGPDPHRFPACRKPGGEGRARHQKGADHPEFIMEERGPPWSLTRTQDPQNNHLLCFDNPIKQSTTGANLALCDVFVTGPIPVQAVEAGDNSIYHLKRALGKSSASLTVGEWCFKGTDAKITAFFPRHSCRE